MQERRSIKIVLQERRSTKRAVSLFRINLIIMEKIEEDGTNRINIGWLEKRNALGVLRNRQNTH